MKDDESNMKKVTTVLLLLLALLCLFGSCTTAPTKDPNESDSESQTGDLSTPETLDGIWYSAENQTVLEISDDLSKATYYRLKVGFYEYETKQNASCTYEDYILKITFEDGKSLSWIFDAQKGKLSANNGTDTSVYSKTEKLPTEYQSVLFADYSKMNCKGLVTLGKHTGLTSAAAADTQAAIQIFDSYYESVEEEPAALTGRTTAQMGDYVKVDYKGYLNDVAFSGGEAKGSMILISENSGYIPGFAEGIAGKEVGSSFDVNVTFPENYHSTDLAGQKVVFKMTLHTIYDLSIADDKIAAFTNNNYSTYQALLDQVKKDYITELLWNDVLKNTTCESMPEDAYAFFLQYYREMYHYYAYYYSVDYETILSLNGLTEETLIQQAKDIALKYLTAYAIIQTYDLTISEDAISKAKESYINDLKTNNGLSQEEAEAYVNAYEMNSVRAEAAVQTVSDWLVQQNSTQESN